MKHLLRLFSLCLLIASSGPCLAQSQPTAWSFTFKGLDILPEDPAGSPRPGGTLSGYFAGTDANADGVLNASELSRLQVEQYLFIPNTYLSDPECIFDASACPNIKVSEFSFDLASTQLSFNVSYVAAFVEKYGFSAQTGVGAAWFDHILHSEERWTPTTTLVVSQVPEPASYALLVLGLCVMGAGMHLRRRGARSSSLVPTVSPTLA